MTAKISGGQFLCLLLICRVSELMTFVPLISEGYSIKTQATAAVISTVIQALLIIPAVLFSETFPERTITAVLAEKNRTAGILTAAVYLLFFLLGSLNAAVNFMRFLNSRFFPDAGYIVMLAVFGGVCIYCAYCGIEGLARSSVFVLIFFFIVLAMMIASSSGNFKSINFYNSFNGSSLPEAVISDLARNSEITAAVFLIKNTDKSCRRGLYGLLGAKLLLTEFIMGMITGILGGYAQLTDYPLMEVGSYSEARLFQRNDALYLIVWTLAAVVTVSFYFRIGAGLLQEIFPKLKGSCAVTGAVVSAAALAFLKFGGRFGSGADIVIGASMILLTGVIPLLVWLLKKSGGKELSKE
ncbi:MAG: GerAB/ArcD/ProY family transporter [Oscillospiraceae bacterium]|nr:GerAB/ArcD/ProY family transporter [Oscillospiraceae bacterium]